MEGMSSLKAGLKTGLYVAAMPARGALAGVSAILYAAGIYASGAGWIVGKPVSKCVELSCKLLNVIGKKRFHIDEKKHAERTVKVFQTAAALTLSVPMTVAAAVYDPIGSIVIKAAIPLGAAINLGRGIYSAKTVYKEYKKLGQSETVKENLFDPMPNIYKDIWSEEGVIDSALNRENEESKRSAAHTKKRTELWQKYFDTHKQDLANTENLPESTASDSGPSIFESARSDAEKGTVHS